MAVLHKSVVVARGARGNAVSLCSPGSIGVTIGITFVVTLLSSKLVFHLLYLILKKSLWILVWLKYRQRDRREDSQDDCEKGIIADSTYTHHAHPSLGSGSHSPESCQKPTNLPLSAPTLPQGANPAQTVHFPATSSHTGFLHTNPPAASVPKGIEPASNSPEVTTQQATPPQASSVQVTPPQYTLLQASSSQAALPATNLPQALVRLLPPLETSDGKAVHPPQPFLWQKPTHAASRSQNTPRQDLPERFNSTSKRALVQQLTRPQHSVITAAPVQVEYRESSLQENGSLGVSVNPFEHEHDSYSIVFPAPGYISSPVAQIATQSETPIVSPFGPYHASWAAPIEMNVGESQFDTSSSTYAWAMNSLPYQWNSSQRDNRGFIGEDHDLSRHFEESIRGENSSAVGTMQTDMVGQAGSGASMPSEGCQSPSMDESQITPRAFIFGQTETLSSQLVPQASNGYQDSSFSYCDISPMNTTSHQTRWGSVDLPSTQLMAGSLCQERRFSRKYRKTSTDSSLDFLPETTCPESETAWQDTTQSLGYDHHAHPSYQSLHKLDTVQTIDWLLNGPSLSSTETSPGTRGSIFSRRTMSTSSVSTASLESLRNPADARAAWTNEAQTPLQMNAGSMPTGVLDQCPSCDLTFSKPGKLSAHYNSVHCRRFPCSICPRAFGLRHDLQRHKHTVHKDIYGPLDTFTCIKDGCAKKFHRKDHFRRHVRNCSA